MQSWVEKGQRSHANTLALAWLLFLLVAHFGETAMSATIMIVEDDTIASAGLTTILESHGYQVVSAGDALMALNLLRSGLRPCLILLDMILPGADGWQFFAERLQAPTAVAAIPVVVMTGVGIASKEWAVAMGAEDLLRKPIDVP